MRKEADQVAIHVSVRNVGRTFLSVAMGVESAEGRGVPVPCRAAHHLRPNDMDVRQLFRHMQDQREAHVRELRRGGKGIGTRMERRHKKQGHSLKLYIG